MKNYGDEGFIRLLRERQEDARNKDIKKGSVWAGDEEIAFKEFEIIKKQLWMWLPEEFGLLGKEIARLKYPYENRPEIIYSNPQGNVNVSFSHKREKLNAGQEEEVRDHIQQVIHKLYPAGGMIEKQTAQAGEAKIAWFDFVTPAIDTEIYNLMFFCPLRGRLLMGACNCLKEDREEWKELFVQMLMTVRFDQSAPGNYSAGAF